MTEEITFMVESDLEVYLTNCSSNSQVSYLALIFNKMLYSSPHRTTNMGTQLSKRM